MLWYTYIVSSSFDCFFQSLALFNMGRACELMVNPQAAQLHFVEALRLIENSSNDDKSRMEHYYQLGEISHFS